MALFETEYLKTVRNDFESIKKLGDRTLARLDFQALNWTPHPDSNSVAVIVKHMRGNMISRWINFLTEDGEKPYRNRDDEFVESYSSADEVVAAWEEGWEAVFNAIGSLTIDDLSKTIFIRGEAHSVLKAVQRQIVHYSNHVGQIVYLGKWLLKEDWESLSIPKGKSQQYLVQKLSER
ncbi:DUF1572 family protein [Bacillus sp. T33-2]|uniref:DUF1572 family protein n=1 Tax=Bacillus sp. T33-2 TaxID=2054168 RepID=UPI000C78BC7D|nr:DUF1572 family protein [Bacillus sp. T33-2]PLR98141.1 hypothetical protein CVD19_05955 [Bacillus sp. T33-2]